jgi:hypothetical protein
MAAGVPPLFASKSASSIVASARLAVTAAALGSFLHADHQHRFRQPACDHHVALPQRQPARRIRPLDAHRFHARHPGHVRDHRAQVILRAQVGTQRIGDDKRVHLFDFCLAQRRLDRAQRHLAEALRPVLADGHLPYSNNRDISHRVFILRMLNHTPIGAQILAGPDSLRRPGPRRRTKFILRRQSQRQKAHRTQIQAARRNVRLRETRLVPAQPESQPAICVERPISLQRAPDHRRQRASHLRRMHTLRQIVAQRHLRQQLERPHPVTQRAPDSRERPVRRDQPLWIAA